ncbi:MAG: DUF4239 domain-containing protein [Proteobacteria bacterium]|nr:DUF4239 domain-containing protein [Pseudomonadota bacterium]
MEQSAFFWLANLPLALSAPLIIGGGVVLSLIGTYVASSIFTVGELQGNNTVGAPKFTFIGQVYSVTLALALVGAWDIYQSARDGVQREAVAMVALDGVSQVFSEPSQREIQVELRQTIQLYGQAVVTKEWKTMSRGLDDPEASHRLNRLVKLYTTIKPLNSVQVSAQQNAMRMLEELSRHRISRVSTISHTLIGLIWALVLAGALVSISFTWFFGSTSVVAQAAMSAIIAAFIMMHLLVILKLTHPFAGETAVSPNPIKFAVQ